MYQLARRSEQAHITAPKLLAHQSISRQPGGYKEMSSISADQ